ncbi:Zinc finger E-box-binding homeobox 2 [Holothuria leucospilota]|uniref:Zinc finger E-box-binding homeobox 2 n=1 Tax=Holothuria leucospilota TaxID=206669 RepID=A0A9Q1BZB7_HOLLE|nr:Zinc finger E-box-binding homeobox 2 [Holothuria leucospilota]
MEGKYLDAVSGDQKICSPTIPDSGYHSDSSTSRASSQSTSEGEHIHMEEGKEETDESLERSTVLQAGGPTLVSPASDVEEDLTNTSERMENEDKDCDSSRSSSPEDNEESETSHIERLMNCPYCERSYKRLTSLREHVKRRHEVNNFSCPQCNYCFAFKSQLERHMSTHMPGRDQVCGVCNRAFADIYRLQRHMLIHASGNRRFPCGECGKAFKYKHHLKEHLRIHSGEKPYECPTCRKRFSHSGSYSSHISSKKCSPIKDLPSMVPKDSAAPVKIVNGEMSPSVLPGKSRFHVSLPKEPLPESYMTPLSITIPRTDTFESEKISSGGTLPPTTPPNDAVKKVLQMVNATVSKQQQEKQHTDISKLKKTKHIPQETPVVASPYELKSFSRKSSTIPLVSPTSKSEGNAEGDGKEVVYVNGNGIHNVDKSYDIVGYTLQKVHEAQAMAKCLESHHPGRDSVTNKAVLQELVYPLLRKGFPVSGLSSPTSKHDIISSTSNSTAVASSFLDFTLQQVTESESYSTEELNLPVTHSDGNPCCKYCRREFESPIDAHQHERYLCDLNADVLKMKLLKSNANQNLNKYFELQRELVASMEKTSNQSPGSSEEQFSPNHSNTNTNVSQDCSDYPESPLQKQMEDNMSPNFENQKLENMPPLPETSQQSCNTEITTAQEQALRAFYAMQAAPSSDGLSKIASALNLSLRSVGNWFEKTRQSEENGSDPSLRGLGLVSSGSPKNERYEEKMSCPTTDVKESTSSADNDRLAKKKEEYECKSRKEKEAAKPPPFSVAHLISPDTPLSKSKRDIRRQKLQQSNCLSPNSNNICSSSNSLRHESPLDLTKSTDRETFARGIPPKLIYGVNYPALYHPGYMLPIYAPEAYGIAQMTMENTLKAQNKVSPDENNRGVKRLPYVPVSCEIGAKRQKTGYGMDYSLAVPPLGPSLPGPEFYQALATASYLQAASAGGSTLPYYGFAFPHGGHLAAANGRSSHPRNSNDAMDSLINSSHHEMIDQASVQPGDSIDKVGKAGNGLYTCSMCPKTFQKHSSLLRHVYEHSGKRPHECEVCGKAFKHKHHLMEHQRLHSGEKPYQCNRCFKKFSHSGSYSQHMNHRYSYCRRGIVGPVCKGDKFKRNNDSNSGDKSNEIHDLKSQDSSSQEQSSSLLCKNMSSLPEAAETS